VSFVVGTGERSSYPFTGSVKGSLARHTGTADVLVLVPEEAGYRFRFLTVGGQALDEGAGACR